MFEWGVSPHMPLDPPRVEQPDSASPGGREQFVNEETLVLRNYDSERTHTVTVQFLDADGDPVFQQPHTLSPLGVVSVAMRLPRAVYLVEVDVDGDHSASAECLVGSGPQETALIEVGNGLVSVSEGVF